MKKLFLVAVLSALVSACSVGVGAGGGSNGVGVGVGLGLSLIHISEPTRPY